MTLTRKLSLNFSFRRKSKNNNDSILSSQSMRIPREDKSKKLIGYDVQKPAGMLPQTLSSRRELVEQLDSEPLFDYLVQNGAMDRPLADKIKAEKSSAKINLALLKHLESEGQRAQTLFINALRQTGQHHLASLLDDSKRINEFSGSGYLSKKRHKGQVTLHIEVKAMRLLSDFMDKTFDTPEGKMNRSATFTINREWICLEDIRMKIQELSEPRKPSVQQFEMHDGNSTEEHPIKKKNSCFCVCFSRLFVGRKGGHPGDKYGVKTNGVHGNERTSESLNNQVSLHYSRSRLSSKNDLENLRNMADTFKQKADIVYDILRDRNSKPLTQLLKYFEQDRGVLVLETNCEDGFVIVNVCMKLDQLENLRRDYNNGKLNKDLENCIVTEETLAKVGAKGIKLSTDVSRDEFDIAEHELG